MTTLCALTIHTPRASFMWHSILIGANPSARCVSGSRPSAGRVPAVWLWALTALSPRATTPGNNPNTMAAGSLPCGVVMAMYHHGGTTGFRTVREGIFAATVLRRVAVPQFPIELHANALALAKLRRYVLDGGSGLWSRVLNASLDARLQKMLDNDVPGRSRDYHFKAYLFKLSALLTTSFARALFIDNDVHIRQPSLVHTLLSRTLTLSDVAAPVDTHRDGKNVALFSTAPPLCTCLLAYRNNEATRSLWLGAAARLVNVSHPAVRQSDQEAVYYEWVEKQVGLRVVLLPEEFYCPFAYAPPAPRFSESSTSRPGKSDVRRYECRATHGHGHARNDSDAFRDWPPWPETLPA
jgi:hypothetical protein